MSNILWSEQEKATVGAQMVKLLDGNHPSKTPARQLNTYYKAAQISIPARRRKATSWSKDFSGLKDIVAEQIEKNTQVKHQHSSDAIEQVLFTFTELMVKEIKDSEARIIQQMKIRTGQTLL